MGKSVLITGTSTGIGLSAAERMAREGWTVYAGIRRQEDADRLSSELPGDVRPLILDVANNDEIDAAVSRLTENLGDRGLDGLVNNAGIADGGPFEAVSEETWRKVFDVNVFGLVNMTREALPLLFAAKGRVVNVGSLNGRFGGPATTTYSATKHAVEAISEGLRFETAKFGLRVSCIEPGQIKTPIWDKAADLEGSFEADYGADMVARYPDMVNMMRSYIEQGATKGAEPEEVADAIHHALTSSRPKDRYPVGIDAKLGAVVTSLPDSVRKAAMTAVIRQQERAGRRMRAEDPQA